MRKEVYGSVAAPSQWRDSLLEAIRELGWTMSDMDPCIFVLKSTTASAMDGIRKDKLFEESVSLLPESARQIPPESFTPIRGFLVVLIDDILRGRRSRPQSVGL